MAASIFKTNATGSAAINTTVTVPAGQVQQFLQATIHFSAAAAATNLTITLDAAAGAVYDVTLVTAAMGGLTNYVYNPTLPLYLMPGDALVFAYANGGGATYGLQVLMETVK